MPQMTTALSAFLKLIILIFCMTRWRLDARAAPDRFWRAKRFSRSCRKKIEKWQHFRRLLVIFTPSRLIYQMTTALYPSKAVASNVSGRPNLFSSPITFRSLRDFLFFKDRKKVTFWIMYSLRKNDSYFKGTELAQMTPWFMFYHTNQKINEFFHGYRAV